MLNETPQPLLQPHRPSGAQGSPPPASWSGMAMHIWLRSTAFDAAPLPWRVAMTEMSRLAYTAYHALVHQDPEFIEFWRNATPIEEISGLKLGSL